MKYTLIGFADWQGHSCVVFLALREPWSRTKEVEAITGPQHEGLVACNLLSQTYERTVAIGLD
jgi:hypothetical protein